MLQCWMKSGFILQTGDEKSRGCHLVIMKKEGDDKIKHPQMRSRRFPIKSIFMGVGGRPRPDNVLMVGFF